MTTPELQKLWIFILLSIKTRIETLKPVSYRSESFLIFILLSIKTRIETYSGKRPQNGISLFLSYYPLKQGLKLKLPSEDVL